MPDDKKPDASVVIGDFPGLYTSADARDLPPGSAVIQVNLTCIRIGELVVRHGSRQLTFEE